MFVITLIQVSKVSEIDIFKVYGDYYIFWEGR